MQGREKGAGVMQTRDSSGREKVYRRRLQQPEVGRERERDEPIRETQEHLEVSKFPAPPVGMNHRRLAGSPHWMTATLGPRRGGRRRGGEGAKGSKLRYCRCCSLNGSPLAPMVRESVAVRGKRRTPSSGACLCERHLCPGSSSTCQPVPCLHSFSSGRDGQILEKLILHIVTSQSRRNGHTLASR
jgi:hypothetical protein